MEAQEEAITKFKTVMIFFARQFHFITAEGSWVEPPSGLTQGSENMFLYKFLKSSEAEPPN